MSRLSRETQDLLERGRRGSAMTPAHKARLRRDVLAKAAGASILLGASSAAGLTSVAAKVAGVVAIVVATGTGVALATHVGSAPRETSARREAPSVARPAARTLKADSVPSVAPILAPVVATPPETTPALSRALDPAIPSPPAVASAPVNPSAPATRSTPAPAPAFSGVAIGGAPRTPAGRATAEIPPASTLEREATLLRDADRALKSGDAERAFALLDEHAASFPRSALEPERSAERIFALCLAGRTTEARDEASVFLRSHPNGPLAARVKSSCGARN